jgi:hypothetical protein
MKKIELKMKKDFKLSDYDVLDDIVITFDDCDDVVSYGKANAVAHANGNALACGDGDAIARGNGNALACGKGTAATWGDGQVCGIV